MMDLSVIVPVYNTAPYLENCLSSLTAQGLDRYEIICVNDGSTDGSLDILDSFQDAYPSLIKIINKSNGGLSSARNAGIEVATGRYIAFVDSDDSVSREMFSLLLSELQKKDADMAICDLQKINADGKVLRELPQLPNYPELFTLSEYPQCFGDMGYFACNKVYRKELFEKNRFTEGVHFEDIDLIPELLLNCRSIINCKKPMYNYFEREGSISKTHTEKGLDMLKAVRKSAEKFRISKLAKHTEVLKSFVILQGFYSFGAYLAFVRDRKLFASLQQEMWNLMKEYGISRKEILSYRRFSKNYLSTLPLSKKLYYTGLILGAGEYLHPLVIKK